VALIGAAAVAFVAFGARGGHGVFMCCVMWVMGDDNIIPNNEIKP
jgi:hypothetical protein